MAVAGTDTVAAARNDEKEAVDARWGVAEETEKRDRRSERRGKRCWM